MYKAVTTGLARLFRSPQYLILFVSDVCWMKCRHCWFNEEWKATHLDPDTLSVDELRRVAASIDRIQFLSLTGGEAFLRREIVDIVDIFAKDTKLARYQIPTAGYKTDLIVRSAEAMLRNNPDVPFRVDVSLDGTKHVHDEIRNRSGAFDNAAETIRALNTLRPRFAHFDVGIITTISHANQHEVEDIAATAERLNPNGEWLVNVARGQSRDPAAIDVDIDRYELAHDLIEERRRRGQWKGHGGHRGAQWLSAKNATRRKIITSILAGKHAGGGCAAGSLGGVLLSDGTVYPCELLDKPFGNVRDVDYDLPRLWNSGGSDDVRAWIQDTRCVCTQECFLSISMLIQPQHWGDMTLERLKLLKASLKQRTVADAPNAQ